MEKIKVNNQVVDMRKYVKQAKIHIINKLTKEVKLLQNRKGNEAQVQKAKRKAERFLEEVAIIKKTKPDDISKVALIKAKNWKEVLQQKNLSLQDRCIAMLANYDPVQKAVEAFHSANKELAIKLADLIEQWEEKKKLSKNSPKIKKIQSDEYSNKKEEYLKSNGNDLSSIGEKLELPNKNREENELPRKKKFKMTKENEVGNVKSKSASEKLKENITSNQSSAQKLFTENDEVGSTISTDKLNNKHDPADSDDSDSDDEMSNTESNAENTLKVRKSSPNKNSVDDENINISNDESDNEESPDEENLIEAEEISTNNDEGSSDEENLMDVKEMANSNDSENVKESVTETKNVGKCTKLDASEFVKKFSENSSKNKLKEIVLLNLDELQGLDEIPINNADISEESDENKTSEDETNDAFEGKRKDPFFLGCGGDSDDEDSSKEKEDFLQKSDRSTVDSGDVQNVKHQFFQTHKSLHKRGFQKFPGQKKDSVPFRSETQQSRNPKFKSKNFHDRFQDKNRNFKNSYGSKIEHKTYPSKESYGMRKKENKPGGLYHRQSSDNSVVKNKTPFKKDITSDKPLHPSWEARRKQKETINTQFQGKRMVFDD